MDPRPTDRERKQELIAVLTRSRENLDRRRRHVRQRLNPVLRLRTAIKKNPLPAFGLAVGGALVLTLLRRRRPLPQAPPPKRTLLRWALSLAKPTAQAWALSKAQEHFSPLHRPPPAHTP